MIEKRYLWALILLFLVGLFAGPLWAWTVDPVRQPSQLKMQNDKQKSPPTGKRPTGKRPIAMKAAPWKPVTSNKARFDQNYSRVQVLTREIGDSINILNQARTTSENMDRMAALRELLDDLNRDLKEVLKELAAMNSLMDDAEILDQQRRVGRNRGNQLASRLEQKRSALEKKKVALAARIKMLNDKLSNMADMHQQDMMKLQEMQSRLSQMMNMLSNIIKSAHDTAQSIIRNMR